MRKGANIFKQGPNLLQFCCRFVQLRFKTAGQGAFLGRQAGLTAIRGHRCSLVTHQARTPPIFAGCVGKKQLSLLRAAWWQAGRVGDLVSTVKK